MEMLRRSYDDCGVSYGPPVACHTYRQSSGMRINEFSRRAQGVLGVITAHHGVHIACTQRAQKFLLRSVRLCGVYKKPACTFKQRHQFHSTSTAFESLYNRRDGRKEELQGH